MKNLVNIEKSLVVAVVNPDYFGRKLFAMYYVQKQVGNNLDALLLWNMDYTNDDRGALEEFQKSVRHLTIDDIWSFPVKLTEAQNKFIKTLNLDYRIYKDKYALERLAEKMDMDLTYIGYEGEPEQGTYFTCCRIPREPIPHHLHAYSLRSSDEDDSQPASIEDMVVVNHYGDILTAQELNTPVKMEIEPIQYDEEGNIMTENISHE